MTSTAVDATESEVLEEPRKRGLFAVIRKVPLDVYLFVVLGVGFLGSVVGILNDYVSRVKAREARMNAAEEEAQAAVAGHAANTDGSSIGILQDQPSSGWGLTPDTFDPTMPLTVAGAGVVVAITGVIVVPRVKKALAKRRDTKQALSQRTAAWSALLGRRDELILAWSKYETDVALMIDYPVMTNYADPIVRPVLSAMQGMRRASNPVEDAAITADELTALQTAVDDFELAFTTAENYAQRIGQSSLSQRERNKLSAARQALNIILDGKCSVHEVQAAYKSLRSSLNGIITLPPKAVAELESKTFLALPVSEREPEFV